jgi:Uma2 family endonuclease
MLVPVAVRVPSADALTVRLPPDKHFTDADVLALQRLNPELRVEQDADGTLIVMPPAGAESGAMNLELAGQLRDWARRDGSGIAFDSSAGFRLPPGGALRSPDASWVARARWEAVPLAQRQRFPRLCPDFVAELRSPSDDLEVVQAKLEEYVAAGARLGWLLDPEARAVWVYKPGEAQPARLSDPLRVAGDPVLPGFALDVPTVSKAGAVDR